MTENRVLTDLEALHIIRAMGGLIKALAKFTSHKTECGAYFSKSGLPCDCGLDALLKNVKEMPL
jgi:hypothetical protein